MNLNNRKIEDYSNLDEKLQKEILKKWFKKNFIVLKTGLQERLFKNYLPFFQFQSNWVELPEGQELLEKIRLDIKMPHQENIRRFAQLYTKKIIIFEDLEMLNFVDRKFFNSVTLYGCLCLIYSMLPDNDSKLERVKIDELLREYLNLSMNKYCNRKKDLKIKWNKLTNQQKSDIQDELLFTLWANLKNLKIISIKQTKKESYITSSKYFDRTILDNSFRFILNDLPCILQPKDWEFITTEEVGGGGYHSFESMFIRKKNEFKGEIKVKKELVDVINKLQKIEWTIDPAAINFVDIEFSKVIELVQKNAKAIRKDEDFFQDLNTALFLIQFCTNFNKFYFPFNIDFRGRLYPLCDWAFSPTSSKRMRSYLRLSKEEKLTNEGKDWLLLKIAVLNNIQHSTLNETLNTVKKNISNFPKLDFDNYIDFQTTDIFYNIEDMSSKHLIQMDATCSAYQLIGIIRNSEKIMKLTNLLDNNNVTKKPNFNYEYNDLYSYIINSCAENLPHPAMKHYLDRNLIKKLIMPLVYGKTEYASMEDLRDYTKSYLPLIENILEINDLLIPTFNELKDKPNKITDYDHYRSSKLYYFARWFFTYFNSVCQKEFPEIYELMNIFKQSSLRTFRFSSSFLEYSHMYNESISYPIRKQKNNQKFKFSFKRVIDKQDTEKEAQGSAANFIHSLDAFIVHYVVKNLPPEIIVYPIHDCFIVCPNHVNILLKTVNDAYNEVQKYIKTIPEFSKFHKEGSVPITSYNILKIS